MFYKYKKREFLLNLSRKKIYVLDKKKISERKFNTMLNFLVHYVSY